MKQYLLMGNFIDNLIKVIYKGKIYKTFIAIVLTALLLNGCQNKEKQMTEETASTNASIESSGNDLEKQNTDEIIDLGVMCESFLADSDGNVYYNNSGDGNVSENEKDTVMDPELIYDEAEDMPEGGKAASNRPENNSDDYKLFCVEGKDSRQKLSYVVYTPAECGENVPIFIFLHGNGDKAQSFDAELKRYAFLRHLQDGSWKPPIIFVMPIAQKKSSWSKEADSVASIIDEVIEKYGGSYDDLYISGASAGSDGLTAIAKKFDFKGAIYMAGHIAGSGNDIPKSDWLELWKDKKVYYYRDDKNSGGGYGYSQNASYLNGIEDSTDEYDVNFDMVDLKWNHDIGLVDATFLPAEFTDANGRPCLDGISKLISGD